MSTKTMILSGALALACAAFAADESADIFMYIQPEQSSFWHTATGSTFNVTVPYPLGATEATLTVSGVQYAGQVIEGITADEVALTLPAATDLATENTYTLTLDFDKGNSVTGVVSVINGTGLAGGVGATRCLSPDIHSWNLLTRYRMTMPVPSGTESLTYNGEEVDTKLDGDQGFCTVPSQAGTYVLTVDEDEYTAELEQTRGLTVIIR